MSGSDAELGRAVRAIADVFATEGTDPLVDWSFPAVHLMHPLSRATIVPYVGARGVGSGVSITRPLWVAEDPEEGAAIATAVAGLTGSDGNSFMQERAEDGAWAAVGYRVVELAPRAVWGADLPVAHRELERSAMAALAVLCGAVKAHVARVAPARSLLLRQAFALLDTPQHSFAGSEDRVAVAAVTRDHVTLCWGAEGLPVFLRLASVEQLDALTLVAGHDGHWSRDELTVLAQVFAVRVAGRSNLRVVEVPGEFGAAVGIVSSLPATVEAGRLRHALECHLDLAREVAGPPRVGRGRA